MQHKTQKLLSLIGLMQVACLLVVICSLAPFFAGWLWYLDLLASFRFQYMVLSVVFILAFVLSKQRIYTMASLCCALINAVYVLPMLSGGPDKNLEHQHRIKLFFANVYTANTAYDQLIKQVQAGGAEVVLLQEIDHRWLSRLNSLKTTHPHTIELPRKDNFGMAIFSQIPITNHQVHNWTALDIPSVELEIEKQGQAMTLITTHPPPPINKYYHEAGIQQFEAISAAMQGQNQATVVIGDLNTTVWSSSYPLLTTKTGLVNASSGHGWMPTWPTSLLPLMIPIDHCLVSEGVKVLSIKTGERFGSDHLPLLVELGF